MPRLPATPHGERGYHRATHQYAGLMPKGRIITVVLAIATILVIISFIDSCHETNDPPPGGSASVLAADDLRYVSPPV